MMEAIVLAGGLGTRLRELITDLPKPMAPIGNRPFLSILLTMLAQKGFSRIILSVGYMAENIISTFGTSYAGMEILYAIEDQPLGTGGGVRLAMDKCLCDHVYVFNGDTFLDLEVDQIESEWNKRSRSIIIGRMVEDTSRYGRILYADRLATNFCEKESIGPGLINAGCYLLHAGQLDSFKTLQSFSLEKDFLPSAIYRGNFDIFISQGKFIDIGVPDDYLRAQTYFNLV